MAKDSPPLLPELSRQGRAFSTATVLLHAAVGERLGLTPRELKSLELLARRGPMTAGEFAEQACLTPPTVTGLMGRLSRKGFVRRAADPEDGRRVLLEVDPDEGARVAARMGLLTEEMQAVAQRYTAEELRLVLRWMEDVTEACQAATRRLLDE